MGRVLLIGDRSVAKGPGPGGNAAQARRRIVGELNIGGCAGERIVAGKIGLRVGVYGNIAGFAHGIGPAGVPGDKGDGIGAGGDVTDFGVLETGGLAVTEIPAPEGWVVGGLIRELDGQGAATGSR